MIIISVSSQKFSPLLPVSRQVPQGLNVEKSIIDEVLEIYRHYQKVADILDKTAIALGRKTIPKTWTSSTKDCEVNLHAIALTTFLKKHNGNVKQFSCQRQIKHKFYESSKKSQSPYKDQQTFGKSRSLNF